MSMSVLWSLIPTGELVQPIDVLLLGRRHARRQRDVVARRDLAQLVVGGGVIIDQPLRK